MSIFSPRLCCSSYHLNLDIERNNRTTTAALKVVNNVFSASDKKTEMCLYFRDLTKAFDSVDHLVLKNILENIRLSKPAVGWSSNYLYERTQSSMGGPVF